MSANGQIRRLQRFCFQSAVLFLELETGHLEAVAKLWAQSRNRSTLTSGTDALDGDVILAARTLSLGLSPDEYIIATTNVGHLVQFARAEL